MLDKELEAVHARVPKPVILTEFGADTLPGNHSTDDLMWSEEFPLGIVSRRWRPTSSAASVRIIPSRLQRY